MSELRKANFDGLFFVTLTVVGWVDVFSRKTYTDILIANLRFCQEHKGIEIYAYVIMTNHIHIIARQHQGQLNKVLGHFKSFTAKEILRAIEENPKESRKDWMLHVFKYHAKYKESYDEYNFWQNSNHATELFTMEVLHQKVNYIYNNPVRAGYVEEPRHWINSSAYARSPIKTLSL